MGKKSTIPCGRHPKLIPTIFNRHWDIFVGLCRRANARGNLVPDAYLAALAIESGSQFTTSDRDF